MAPSLRHDERVPRWYARYERLAMEPGTARAIYATRFEIDVHHVLPAIRLSTLVLQRSGDRHVPVGHGHYLAQHIPGTKYVELPGGYLEQPGATVVRARATDLAGRTQPESPEWNRLGYGANSIPEVPIHVR